MNLQTTLNTNSTKITALKRLGIKNLTDLFSHFPREWLDLNLTPSISELTTNKTQAIKGILSQLHSSRTKTGKIITKAKLLNSTESVELIWWSRPFLTKQLTNSQELFIIGKPDFKNSTIIFQNPEIEFPKPNQPTIHLNRIVPIYPETYNLNSKWLRNKIFPLLHLIPKFFPDYLPEKILIEQNLCSLPTAIKNIHFPNTNEELIQAKNRLAFDEMFLIQLKAISIKQSLQETSHESLKLKLHPKFTEFIKSLPFELTSAQKKSLAEIIADLQKPTSMSRLLQGEVGSGKTIVAGLALYLNYLNQKQGALMAPTSILATQHYNSLSSIFAKTEIKIQLLTGSTNKKEKKLIYEKTQKGEIDLLIGTHALIQEGLQFQNLGLAVIDEQHRFGVKQRNILKSPKTQTFPHFLNLSATPIPRTIALTIYGEQDLSIIDEMPKGRKPIITRLVPEQKRIDAYRWIEEQIKKGRQAFIICPLIDESDKSEFKAVHTEYQHLKKHIFPNLNLGFLHGKMKASEKEEIMTNFKLNKLQILVSTSVIEVGIDIPNATIMIIEGSERFGLSQLHQFRGRVGRGDHQSYCFLFTQNRSQQNLRRLKAMTEHNSGFKLSEIDLEIRGPGNIYGVKQSGLPEFKFASLTDSKNINRTRQLATYILTIDPTLKTFPQLKQKLNQIDQIFIND